MDDNVDAAQSPANLLTLSGRETLIVHDEPQAVEAALTWRPDVALLDIGLPPVLTDSNSQGKFVSKSS